MRLHQPVPIFRTNLVRGFCNKEMEIQNKGAVLVPIAPLFISQSRNQNQVIRAPSGHIWCPLSQPLFLPTSLPL